MMNTAGLIIDMKNYPFFASNVALLAMLTLYAETPL
jgi:hypothetical protein